MEEGTFSCRFLKVFILVMSLINFKTTHNLVSDGRCVSIQPQSDTVRLLGVLCSCLSYGLVLRYPLPHPAQARTHFMMIIFFSTAEL